MTYKIDIKRAQYTTNTQDSVMRFLIQVGDVPEQFHKRYIYIHNLCE